MKKIQMFFTIFIALTFSLAIAQPLRSVLQDDVLYFDVLSIFFGDIHFDGQFALKGVINKAALDLEFLYHPKSTYTSYYRGVRCDWDKKYGRVSLGFDYYLGVAPYGFYVGPYFAYFAEKFTGPVTINTTLANTTLKYGDYERKNTIVGIQAGFNYIFNNGISLGVQVKYPLLVFGDDPISQPPEEYVKTPKGYIYIGYKF